MLRSSGEPPTLLHTPICARTRARTHPCNSSSHMPSACTALQSGGKSVLYARSNTLIRKEARGCKRRGRDFRGHMEEGRGRRAGLGLWLVCSRREPSSTAPTLLSPVAGDVRQFLMTPMSTLLRLGKRTIFGSIMHTATGRVACVSGHILTLHCMVDLFSATSCYCEIYNLLPHVFVLTSPSLCS